MLVTNEIIFQLLVLTDKVKELLESHSLTFINSCMVSVIHWFAKI